jgi:hypothetical protein
VWLFAHKIQAKAATTKRSSERPQLATIAAANLGLYTTKSARLLDWSNANHANIKIKIKRPPKKRIYHPTNRMLQQSKFRVQGREHLWEKLQQMPSTTVLQGFARGQFTKARWSGLYHHHQACAAIWHLPKFR